MRSSAAASSTAKSRLTRQRTRRAPVVERGHQLGEPQRAPSCRRPRVTSQWSTHSRRREEVALLQRLELGVVGHRAASACHAGSGAGGNSRRSDTVVSVTTTSSGGGDGEHAGRDLRRHERHLGDVGEVLVQQEEAGRDVGLAARRVAHAVVDEPRQLAARGASRARPGSPSQTHTRPSDSWTGNDATRAPNGTRGWVGTLDALAVGVVDEAAEPAAHDVADQRRRR